MMRMLGIAFLGLFLWATSVVHAKGPDFKAMVEPKIIALICKLDNNKCSFGFDVYQNNKSVEYYTESPDCKSAQKNGYTFTRTPDDETYYVQSPCSGMTVDTLSVGVGGGRNKCGFYLGSICQKKTTA
ncbi:hypothetical protein BCR42DRAFT_438555 [Absidia repens]|uniref:Uncharacterized protein n=1 Tax=Absidia repens TaxID=90262 RepID=A0A1X2IFK2_9FUNG|nr:hypothetical protein BCR42DRAFT_438555 [Absidia repens]